MRKSIKSITQAIGLLALLGVSSAHASWSYYGELGTEFSPEKNANSLSSYLYVSGSYKINDNWSTGFETSHDIGWVSANDFDYSFDHGYIRVPLSRKNLNWLSGWKTSFLTRWEVPTNTKQQTAGGLGDLMLRPTFSKTTGKWSFVVRPQVKFALTDRGYQKFVEPGKTPAGNSLFSWAVEFFPGYNIAEGLDVTILSGVSQGYKGGAPGLDGAWGKTNLSYEIWVTNPYKVAGFDSWVGFGGQSTTLNKDFSLFSFDKLTYNLYISRSF